MPETVTVGPYANPYDLQVVQNSADLRITAVSAAVSSLAARVTALETPPAPPPPPPPARVVGPVYYLKSEQLDFAKSQGITVAHDWVPQAVAKFDLYASKGMQVDIELAAHAGADGGADTPAEVEAWLRLALSHPKAQQVVRRVMLADEVDAGFYPQVTPAFLKPLYDRCKLVAPQWPVHLLVIAHDQYWNAGVTQQYLVPGLFDVLGIDHYVYNYPARTLAQITQQIESAVRRVRAFGVTKPINFICQAFAPGYGGLTLPGAADVRDMGLAALRGGATDVGMYVGGQYTNTLWPYIGIAARAWV